MRYLTITIFAAIGALPIGTASFETVAPGLIRVQNQAETPSDVQLQLAVVQAMQTSPLTAHSQIVVHVRNGEVTLEGAATSPLARREATRLVETVLGVRAIHNRLSVINSQTAETLPGS